MASNRGDDGVILVYSSADSRSGPHLIFGFVRRSESVVKSDLEKSGLGLGLELGELREMGWD